MKVNAVQQNRYEPVVAERERKSVSEKKQGEGTTSTQDYDQILSTEPKATYEKPKVSREATIARLKEESERIHAQLTQLVRELLERQGKVSTNLTYTDYASLQPDAIAVEEAQALIGPDGPLGAEQTSERIVEFAKALAGNNPEKIPELRAAIDKAFKEVEGMLGGLPQVSQETYRMVMDKLDQWEQSLKGDSASAS